MWLSVEKGFGHPWYAGYKLYMQTQYIVPVAAVSSAWNRTRTNTKQRGCIKRHLHLPGLIKFTKPRRETWIEAWVRCQTVDLIIFPGLELRWTFMCLDKWSLRANFLSHSEHSYGLTPEWDRRWRDSSSDRENLETQVADRRKERG